MGILTNGKEKIGTKSMSQRIQITVTTARWLLQQATLLIADGVGEIEAIDQGTGEIHDAVGFLDEIPADSNVHLWASALLQFARAVAGIVNNELMIADDEPLNLMDLIEDR